MDDLIKGFILIVLMALIVAVAMAIDMLRRGDQYRLDNMCKNGVDIPLAKGSIINSSLYTFPSEDTTFHVDLGC